MVKKPVPKHPYDIPWILQRFRAFLLGREHNSALRWAKDLAPKTQPLPELPPGPSSKIRFNYYCDRDAGREVARPMVVYDAAWPKVAGVDEPKTQESLAVEKEKGGGVGGKEGKEVRGVEIKDQEADRKVQPGSKEKEKDSSNILEKNVKTSARPESGKVVSKEESDEKEGNDTSKKEEEKATSKKTEEKVEKDMCKVEEKQENIEMEEEAKDKNKKTQQDYEAYVIKRVPGKVWHWDMIEDGDPGKEKECCKIRRDGY